MNVLGEDIHQEGGGFTDAIHLGRGKCMSKCKLCFAIVVVVVCVTVGFVVVVVSILVDIDPDVVEFFHGFFQEGGRWSSLALLAGFEGIVVGFLGSSDGVLRFTFIVTMAVACFVIIRRLIHSACCCCSFERFERRCRYHGVLCR